MADPTEAGQSNTKSWDGTSHRVDLKGHNDNYGTPVEGTKTDMRARKAGLLVTSEVIELCQIIHDLGQRLPDGRTWGITFKDLFEFYTKISNKLVGMLIRARKHGLVQFEGEMLFQGRDNHVIVYLVNIPEALKSYVQQKDGITF